MKNKQKAKSLNNLTTREINTIYSKMPDFDLEAIRIWYNNILNRKSIIFEEIFCNDKYNLIDVFEAVASDTRIYSHFKGGKQVHLMWNYLGKFLEKYK